MEYRECSWCGKRDSVGNLIQHEGTTTYDTGLSMNGGSSYSGDWYTCCDKPACMKRVSANEESYRQRKRQELVLQIEKTEEKLARLKKEL
jgi:hypothetical protein